MEVILPIDLHALTADRLARAGWKLRIGLGTVSGSLIVVTTTRGRVELDNWSDLAEGLDYALSVAAGGCGWRVIERPCMEWVS